MKDILILGIESSCDETAAAVVKNGREALSNVINSQIDIHKRYGGVVPEIASRCHIEAVNSVVDEALEKAGVFCEETENTEKREITKLDLYEDGLSGRADSDALRKKLLFHLQLPERLTSNALVRILNTFLTYDEYKKAVEEIKNA